MKKMLHCLCMLLCVWNKRKDLSLDQLQVEIQFLKIPCGRLTLRKLELVFGKCPREFTPGTSKNIYPKCHKIE